MLAGTAFSFYYIKVHALLSGQLHVYLVRTMTKSRAVLGTDIHCKEADLLIIKAAVLAFVPGRGPM